MSIMRTVGRNAIGVLQMFLLFGMQGSLYWRDGAIAP